MGFSLMLICDVEGCGTNISNSDNTTRIIVEEDACGSGWRYSEQLGKWICPICCKTIKDELS